MTSWWVDRPVAAKIFLFSSLFFYCPIRFCSWTTDGQLPAASCVSSLFFIGVFFSTLLIGRTDPSPPLLPSTQSFWYANELSLSLSLSLSGRYSWSPRLRAPFSFHWIPFAADFIINGARLTLTTVHYLKNHSVRSKLGEILGEKNPKLCIAFHPRDPIGSWFFLLLLPASVCVCVCVCVSFSGVLDMQMR